MFHSGSSDGKIGGDEFKLSPLSSLVQFFDIALNQNEFNAVVIKTVELR
jgi:hypothetical protein